MDRAPVRRTPAPPEGHGSSWPTWRGAPLSFEGPGIVLFGSMSRTGPPGASFALWLSYVCRDLYVAIRNVCNAPVHIAVWCLFVGSI